MYEFELSSNNKVVARVQVSKLDCATIQLRYNVCFSEAAECVAVKLFKQRNPGFNGSLVAAHCW